MTPDEYWNRRLDLERRLHDGPALRLAALTLRLGLLGEKVAGLQPDIAGLQHELHLTLQELRVIADQIYPPLLRRQGLGPALRELTAGLPTPVRVDVGGGRFEAAVEGVAYYTVCEVLEGAGDATRTVDITVRRDDQGLVLHLAGVDTDQVLAVRDRIQWLGGAVEIVGGAALATIRVRIPCG
ncbi:hypothetical protein [Actinoplanes sp. M2I2]|uniref:hypothetical protein n=1 Tax=Actinoplanes sp. M2I2 TaxID=1734444 RepID=UPI002020F0D9|nr:hypothetical protein [Actinoplanes sp. M2I2]